MTGSWRWAFKVYTSHLLVTPFVSIATRFLLPSRCRGTKCVWASSLSAISPTRHQLCHCVVQVRRSRAENPCNPYHCGVRWAWGGSKSSSWFRPVQHVRYPMHSLCRLKVSENKVDFEITKFIIFGITRSLSSTTLLTFTTKFFHIRGTTIEISLVRSCNLMRFRSEVLSSTHACVER